MTDDQESGWERTLEERLACGEPKMILALCARPESSFPMGRLSVSGWLFKASLESAKRLERELDALAEGGGGMQAVAFDIDKFNADADSESMAAAMGVVLCLGCVAPVRGAALEAQALERLRAWAADEPELVAHASLTHPKRGGSMVDARLMGPLMAAWEARELRESQTPRAARGRGLAI